MENLNLEIGENLYLKLYNFLKKEIESKKITYKLPALRKISSRFGVSMFTVIKAYELLEKEGYIFSKKGSGFFIKQHNENSYFYPEDYMINEDFKYNYFNENCKVNFSSASPKNNFFPIEFLKDSINNILDLEGEKALLYENPQGNLKFRRSIKSSLKALNIETNIENIQIISGAQQGINLIAKILLQNKDIIVVEDPTYKGAINSFKERGAFIKKIPILSDGIDLIDLEKFLKNNRIKLLYTIPIFQNPTGVCMSERKKIRLLELAEKYDFYLIEDDSNSDIYFEKKIFPLKSYDKNNRVIYIKSFSKIFMPGFRIGFMIAPKNLIQDIVKAKYLADISTSGLNQRIFQYFLENKIWNEYTSKLRDEFFKKQSYIYSKLEKIENICCTKPKGGLFFWIKLPEDITGEALHFKLLSSGISVIPGTIFSSSATNYIRLSFAQCNYEEIDFGLEKLSEYVGG